VLTGAGDKAFCAGADLQNSGAAFATDFSRPNVDYADLLRLSQNATKPAIARVGGVCMAGGMGLLCMTDMAVAADHVIFGLPEVKVGVFPMQVMSLLQSIAPPRLVNEWALTGEPFDAKSALAAGLLNYVVPSAGLGAKQGAAVLDQHAAGHRHHAALCQRIHRPDEIGLLLRALEQGARSHAQCERAVGLAMGDLGPHQAGAVLRSCDLYTATRVQNG